MKKIYLEGIPSTISAMEWIRANDCPRVVNLEVYFEKGRRDGLFDMMISSLDECDLMATLDRYPIEVWHEYDGMRRLRGYSYALWYFYIDGSYYYATV